MQDWTSFCVSWTHRISTPVISQGHGSICICQQETHLRSTITPSWLGSKICTLKIRCAFLICGDLSYVCDDSLQCQRAVKFIRAAVLFRNSLDDRQLEPDVFHLNPQKSDTELFRNIVRYARKLKVVLISAHYTTGWCPAPSPGTWPTCGRPSPLT